MASESFKVWGPKDVVAPLQGLKKWSKLLKDTRTRTDDDYHFEPSLAPSSWWSGLENVAQNVLFTAGEQEGMVDDIILTESKMKEVAGDRLKLASFVQEGVSHNEPIVDFAVSDPPGPTNLRVLAWIKEAYLEV